MSRRLLRLPFMRVFGRAAAPVLPLTRPLTNTARAPPLRLFSTSPRLRSSSPNSHSHSRSRSDGDPSSDLPPNASLSTRLKHLIKSYGWYALGVYIALSTIDFGVAFALINVVGAEHVAKLAASAKHAVAPLFALAHPLMAAVGLGGSDGVGGGRPAEPGTEEIERAGNEGLYAMLLLAYTVHKTLFLPIRVGLTAAVTPRLVRWLRTRGWAGREGTKRAAGEVREAARDVRERIRTRGRE
ncbi:hypothetical protein CYLTODRAFT_425523 [Cylindrobasidium torrendii FP15055 ss-10]|uniref:DUF1279 domain-containing protein n=1 Tax=Cylindrobasidium torrendii FP15055 ss-10 TaxID=1314674 RepID=A0A0D7B0C9_9AGAR|nr:hypothetical protein CYLTODRAFT_425523 [Cylindrobasidium torrendii FP15055 ss-10]